MSLSITPLEPNGGNPAEELNEVQFPEIEAAINNTNGVELPDIAEPGVTTNKLYSIATGLLKWAGKRVATWNAAPGNAQIVETNGSGQLITNSKNTAYNKDFGTTAGTVAEGDALAARAADSAVVHNSGAETIAGVKTFSSSPIVPDAVNANEAVNKSQLDAARAGLIVKDSVRVASTANVNISNPGTSTFDGVTLANGEDILLKDQTAGSQNGIYVFNGSSSAMTRRSDADSSAEVKTGMAVWVSEGTANADKRFALSTNAPIVLGTTSLTFVQDSAASGVVAVTGSSGIASSGGSSPNLTLDIAGLGAENTLVDVDGFAFLDNSSGLVKKTTLSYLADWYGSIARKIAALGIGTSGTNHASALLQVDSTTQGILPPRLTTTQRNAISSPATGLEIYNITTGQKESYNGSIWGGIASLDESILLFSEFYR